MRKPILVSCSVFSLMLALALLSGCSKHDSVSSSSGGAAGSADSSGPISGDGDSVAVAAVHDEIVKHWVQTPDGLISEFPSHVYIASGQRADAESFYRQIKQIKFNITANDLSDADKLNGIQYDGLCEFQGTPLRIYNDPNSFDGKKWSQWQDGEPATWSLKATKKNGQWSIHGDSWMITGTQPSAATIAQLK